jgi:hypothetical protein
MERITVSLTLDQVDLLIGLLSERFTVVHTSSGRPFAKETLAELDAISRAQAVLEIASEPSAKS